MAALLDTKRGKRRLFWLVVMVLFTLRTWHNTPPPPPPSTTSAEEWQHPSPHLLQPGEIMHLVKTRFMQHQGHLVHLARARLQLFQAVCLPSMIRQSNSNFAWIISVDPDLDFSVLSDLLQVIRPYAHFYLSLTNDSIKPGGGLHGIGDRIVTGDTTVLRNNLRRWDEHAVVLETQLDADDALHVDYISDLQKRAQQTFLDSFDDRKTSPDWMYWCIHRDVEWHWVQNDTDTASVWSPSPSGFLKASRSFVDKQKCYTPGMTLGTKGGSKTQVLDVPHSLLYSQLTTNEVSCGGKHNLGKDCLQFVDSLEYPALRARALTSASMVGVTTDLKQKGMNNKDSQDLLWHYVTQSFGVSREAMAGVNQYLCDDMALILRDAVEGQCSHGHSCREEAQHVLRSFLQLYHTPMVL